jgi:SulP family sulfate permease
LEGSIFFGTADSLSAKVDQLTGEGVREVILDMKRVNEIDSTGARILKQIYTRLVRRRGDMAISYLEEDGRLWHFLKDMGIYRVMGRNRVFPDTDLALEYFEDRILAELLPDSDFSNETMLERLMVLQGLDRNEVKVLARYLALEKYNNAETVIRQGEAGDALYFIVRGSADVTIDLPGTRRRKRIQTFSAGTFFGEMALLDGKPRSANVEARETLVVYKLGLDEFHRLKTDYPHISITLMTNISRTLAARLRFANEMISELEV